MYTWWVAVGSFKIYATRNFPFLRFIINAEYFLRIQFGFRDVLDTHSEGDRLKEDFG